MNLYLDLFNALLPSAGLVLAAWIAMRVLRLNAATRYAAWWAVLALLLLMPFIAHEIRNSRQHEGAPLVTLSATPAAVTAAPAESAPPAADRRSTSTPQASFLRRAERAIPPIYAGILIFLALRLLLDYVRMRAMVRSAVPFSFNCEMLGLSLGIERKVRVLLSPRVETPLVTGFFKPSIVLPAALAGKLSDSELRHVIVHELAHIARRDDWTNLLGKLLQAFCWPHPLVAVAIRRIEAEREHACDDWVVSATGGAANSYAKSLARLVELAVANRQPILASTVVGQGPRVSKRVEMLLDGTRNFAPRISFVKLGMSIVCLLVLGIICAQAPALLAVAQPEHQDSSGRRVPAPEFRQGFLASLAAAGYGDLPVDEIIDLKNHGIDARFIADMAGNGWGKLTPKELMMLHDHGVTGAYLRAMKAAGIRDLTLEKTVHLRNQGVRPESVIEIHSLGFGPYDLDEILQMASHGLRPDFFRGLKERGITQISARNAIDAASNGLTPRSIDEARKFGPNLTFEQILKLKRAGVI